MSDASTPTPDPERPAGDGFSGAEKALGAWAAYEHPLVSGAVAGHMLKSETDPTRRRQLETFRKASFLWGAVGVVAAVIGLIVVLAVAGSHGAGGGCRGGPDKFDVMNITYQSVDNKHWTATYPCNNGGSTTIPVPRKDVPGAGR